MENFEQWVRGQFSILPLFDVARPTLPASAGELAIGVFALHHRARKEAWEQAMLLLDTTDPLAVNAIRYSIALSQAANRGTLEQELAGMTFRVEAQPHAAEDTILHNSTHPVRRAVGSVSGAYPPSFRVECKPDAIRLSERNIHYIINPLDTNGMPQVTMQYIPPSLLR